MLTFSINAYHSYITYYLIQKFFLFIFYCQDSIAKYYLQISGHNVKSPYKKLEPKHNLCVMSVESGIETDKLDVFLTVISHFITLYAA